MIELTVDARKVYVSALHISSAQSDRSGTTHVVVGTGVTMLVEESPKEVATLVTNKLKEIHRGAA